MVSWNYLTEFFLLSVVFTSTSAASQSYWSPPRGFWGFKKSGIVERLFGVRYSDFIPEFQFSSADKNSLGGFEHLSTYRSLIAFQSGQKNIFVLQDTPWSSLFVQNAFLQYLILKFPENSKNFKNTRFPYYLSVPLQFFSFLFYFDRKKP